MSSTYLYNGSEIQLSAKQIQDKLVDKLAHAFSNLNIMPEQLCMCTKCAASGHSFYFDDMLLDRMAEENKEVRILSEEKRKDGFKSYRGVCLMRFGTIELEYDINKIAESIVKVIATDEKRDATKIPQKLSYSTPFVSIGDRARQPFAQVIFNYTF